MRRRTQGLSLFSAPPAKAVTPRKLRYRLAWLYYDAPIRHGRGKWFEGIAGLPEEAVEQARRSPDIHYWIETGEHDENSTIAG